MKKIYDGIIGLVEKYYWILFVGMVFVTGFLCFRCLDVAYVSSWDEARHGISAYEMMQNGNYIVNTFGYEPDYWNLKPPLSFYGIILGFKLFGYSVMGLRFYSACSYLITCIAVGLYLKKYHKLTSLIGMCFLCCNYMVLGFHCARSGDADALFLMFFVLAMLAMLEVPKKHWNLYACGFCFACAFLSKSFHSGVIVAIGGLYLVFTGEIVKIKPKEWVGFVLSFLIPMGIWFVSRYSQDGMLFFQEMVFTDLLSRSSSASEGHSGNFLFYYHAYFEDFGKIYPYLLSVAVCGTLGYGIKALVKRTLPTEQRKEVIGYGLWLIVPFLFFSAVSTKLIWYGYPIFIPLSIIAAVFVGKLLTEELFRDKAFVVVIKGIVAVGCVYLIITMMYSTYLNAVREIHGDEMQQFIAESVERDSEYAGLNAYVEAPQEMEDGTVWNQHVRFIAKISGDFKCQDGGIKVFLEEKEAVLYITKDRYIQWEALLENHEILFEKGNYMLLK